MSPSQALALLSPAFTGANSSISPGLDAHPTRWADLGCGQGLFTLALSTLLQPGSTIYAVDRQPRIKTQTTPNQISIEPIKTDFGKKTDWSVFNLDGILMANSLHYVKDKSTLIQNLQKTILLPQHRFLIIEYDTDRATPIWVPYPISFAALQPLFEDLGYATITRLADQPSIYNRNSIYSALITE